MVLGSQIFSQPDWKFSKWEEMMDEQAEGLKALPTFLGVGVSPEAISQEECSW